MSSVAVEFALLLMAASCGVTAVMTFAIMMAPWEMLEWRLLTISAMSLLTSLLVLWVAVTTT